MAIATTTSYGALLKESFSSDDLEAMFWKQTKWLDKVKNVGSAFTIGDEVKVPLLTDLAGGYSVKDKAGGLLNPANHIKTATAAFEIVYHYFQVGTEMGLINQANGSSTSVGIALDQELTNALAAIYRQVERQAIMQGDALIAECAETTNSDVVHLAPGGFGHNAIVRKWLYPGLPIDIGTAADEDSEASNRVIEAVDKNPADPTITISGANVSTAAGDFVSIHGARAGTASLEQPGIMQIAGSADALGGKDASNAGEEYWQPAAFNDDEQDLSLELLADLQDSVLQESGGEFPDLHLTSIKQQSRFYLQLQAQSHFTGDMNLGAGAVDKTNWNGIKPTALAAVPDRLWAMLTMKDFIRVGGKYTKPVWMSEIEGANKGLRYNTGNTDFGDTLGYFLNIVPKRRNRHAAATNLRS